MFARLRGIWRVLDQVPVVIRRAVFPPDRAAFTQGNLAGMNLRACGLFRLPVAGLQRRTYSAACIHQAVDQRLALAFGKAGIAGTP